MKKENNKFTDEEIRVLKEFAQNKLFFEELFKSRDLKDFSKLQKNIDQFGRWDDAYTNLKRLGYTHDHIIKQIGENK